MWPDKAKRLRVTVIGTGYVGSVTGACLSYLGYHVTCVDTDSEKIARWKSGEPAIYEPFLKGVIAAGARRGTIRFTTDLTEPVRTSDVIFIAVGTPPLPDGSPNLRYLEAAAHDIGAAMDGSRFRVIVNKSTVPVGSGNLVEMLVRDGIAEARPAERHAIDFDVVSNPEFLREGCAVADSLYPDRIVVGASGEKAVRVMQDLYAPLREQVFEPPPGLPRPISISRVPIVITTPTSAEMIKYAANAFLTIKIGFANEIANLCELIGAEGTEVMRGIGLDSRIGSRFLNAGIGWGGSCFGKDVRALLHTASEYGYSSKLLQASLDLNTAQRHLIIRKIQEKLFILKGRTVGLLGLAFKPDTDDLRDAPSLDIAARLIRMGVRVKAYDPIAMNACREQYPELKIRYCESAREVANDADALVLVTEWRQFRDLPLAELANLMAKPILIDGRNLFDPTDAQAAGFEYAGIGRTVQANIEKRKHDRQYLRRATA